MTVLHWNLQLLDTFCSQLKATDPKTVILPRYTFDWCWYNLAKIAILDQLRNVCHKVLSWTCTLFEQINTKICKPVFNISLRFTTLHNFLEPPLCHSPGGSTICYEFNIYGPGWPRLDQTFLGWQFWPNWRRSMSNLYVLSQTGWRSMLGRDEQMQSGFVNFQNFAHGFGFARREAIFRPGS